MSQTNLIINPTIDTGSDLSEKLNAWREAIHSAHLGPGRPDYAVSGTFWLNQVSETEIEWYLFDGNQDVLIGRFNPSQSGLLFNGTSTTTIGETPPTSARIGDTWFEADSGHLYIYYQNPDNSYSWVHTGGGGGGGGANGGGASVFVQETAPENQPPGTIWMESDTGRMYFRYQNPFDLHEQWISPGMVGPQGPPGKDGGGAPKGLISMWYGEVSTVPEGWAVCDGTNDTPNLTDKFVIGAGANAVGSSGGYADACLPSHTHTLTDPGHSHGWNVGSNEVGTGDIGLGGANDNGKVNSTIAAPTGITIDAAGEDPVGRNIPPFFALLYIIKL